MHKKNYTAQPNEHHSRNIGLTWDTKTLNAPCHISGTKDKRLWLSQHIQKKSIRRNPMSFYENKNTQQTRHTKGSSELSEWLTGWWTLKDGNLPSSIRNQRKILISPLFWRFYPGNLTRDNEVKCPDWEKWRKTSNVCKILRNTQRVFTAYKQVQ